MPQTEALFLPVNPGQRLCLVHVPSCKPRGLIVHAPAFAEEMNKSRRQVALTARALAEAGFVVVLPDLLGCGDSSGDFGDADWTAWRHDMEQIGRWARARFDGPMWLWGLRAGALLAADAAAAFPGSNLLLWQPVVSGKLHLTQFLRLKVANEALAEAAARSGTKDIQRRLMAGESEEIAGYRLAPAMARGLDAAELSLPENFSGRVAWFEVGAAEPVQLLPRSQTVVSSWAESGHKVDSGVVEGESFWQTVETSICPALTEATVKLLGVCS